jgi:hypothetical protein
MPPGKFVVRLQKEHGPRYEVCEWLIKCKLLAAGAQSVCPSPERPQAAPARKPRSLY